MTNVADIESKSQEGGLRARTTSDGKVSPVSCAPRLSSSDFSEGLESQHSVDSPPSGSSSHSRSDSFSRKSSFSRKDSSGSSPPSAPSLHVSSSNSNVTPPRKQSWARPKSSFDSETLALIREIGSALLNSPAKCEMKEDDSVDLKEGESLVKHYVRKIDNLSVTPRRPRREIVIIDRPKTLSDNETKVERDIKPSKWSPVGKRNQTLSACSNNSPDSELGSNLSTQNQTAKQSDTNTGTESASKNVVQLDTSSAFQTSKSSNAETTDSSAGLHEVCSVRDLRGKFELPDLPGTKSSTSVVSPTGISPVFTGVRYDSKSIEAKAPSTQHLATGTHTDSKMQDQSVKTSPLVKRQSEPAIHLCERSMKLFESKLHQMGEKVALCDHHDTSPVKEEGESDNQFSNTNDQTPDHMTRSSPTKRRASGPAYQRGHRSLGSASGRGFLRESQSLLEGEEPQFTWEGKKVRKSYGKSHPLAKLEQRHSMEVRTNPFYSSM